MRETPILEHWRASTEVISGREAPVEMAQPGRVSVLVREGEGRGKGKGRGHTEGGLDVGAD